MGLTQSPYILTLYSSGHPGTPGDRRTCRRFDVHKATERCNDDRRLLVLKSFSDGVLTNCSYGMCLRSFIRSRYARRHTGTCCLLRIQCNFQACWVSVFQISSGFCQPVCMEIHLQLPETSFGGRRDLAKPLAGGGSGDDDPQGGKAHNECTKCTIFWGGAPLRIPCQFF